MIRVSTKKEITNCIGSVSTINDETSTDDRSCVIWCSIHTDFRSVSRTEIWTVKNPHCFFSDEDHTVNESKWKSKYTCIRFQKTAIRHRCGRIIAPCTCTHCCGELPSSMYLFSQSVSFSAFFILCSRSICLKLL